jgi:hypothetical protein
MPINASFWDFNIGHVFTIGMGLLSIVIMWTKLTDRVDSISGRLSRNESEMDTITRMGLMTTVQQHERRINEIESAIKDVTSIKADLTWIKDRLMRDPNL